MNTPKMSSVQTELALHLCWAIGEHGGGGVSHKDTARELFESLELLLYENISSRLVFDLSKLNCRPLLGILNKQ